MFVLKVGSECTDNEFLSNGSAICDYPLTMNKLLLLWITQFVDDGHNVCSQVFAIQLQLLHAHLYLSALEEMKSAHSK
jgi:hypothetical protein